MVTDEALVARLARGEGGALDQLLKRYEQPIARFVHRRTFGRDVEDLYQEIWLRVVRGADGFQVDQRFRPWLFQIAVNVCRDWWRARSRVAEVEAEPAWEHSGTRDIDAALDLEGMLARLPDEQREVVALRYLQDLSEKEAAEILDCPAGTVKSRLHHALNALARMAGEKSVGETDERRTRR